MKIETMWVVMDPSPASLLVDVMWEATPYRLACAIVGMAVAQHRLETIRSLAIYTTEQEARADAEARLAKRGAAPMLASAEATDAPGSASEQVAKDLDFIDRVVNPGVRP